MHDAPTPQSMSPEPLISPAAAMPRRRARPAARVLATVARVAPGLKPVAQKVMVRIAYEFVCLFGRGAGESFMNYGYATLEGSGHDLDLRPEDESNRFSAQLYNAVVRPADLRGKDVLEVGSGRGGGASFITRYFFPRRYVGVDLAAKAVAMANTHHRLPGLSFQQGDAEKLQFLPESFDVVVNVESSHTYPSVPRFVNEVYRVLRPGGHFVFADLRPARAIEELRAHFQAAGFEIVEEERITPNVLRSLDLDEERRRAMIPRRAPRWIKDVVGAFVGVRNGELYNALESGRWAYVRFALRKR